MKSVSLFQHNLMLYSQTKGVKQKYIPCISGLVVYRQYIHNCNRQVDPHLAHSSESSIRSSAPLAWLRPPGWPLLQLSAALLSSRWYRRLINKSYYKRPIYANGLGACGDIRLILRQRIDDLSNFTAGREYGRRRREPASGASRVYLSPTIVLSLPL